MAKFTVNADAHGRVAKVTISKSDMMSASLSGIAYKMRVPVSSFSFQNDDDREVIVPKDEKGTPAKSLFVEIDADLVDTLVGKGLAVSGEAAARFVVESLDSTTLVTARATPASVRELTEADILGVVKARSARIAAAKARKAAAEAADAASAPGAN